MLYANILEYICLHNHNGRLPSIHVCIHLLIFFGGGKLEYINANYGKWSSKMRKTGSALYQSCSQHPIMGPRGPGLKKEGKHYQDHKNISCSVCSAD